MPNYKEGLNRHQQLLFPPSLDEYVDKDNPAVLKQLFRDFVLLCRSVDLIDGAVVAIGGAFLRANASKNQLISDKMTRKDMATVEEKITEYLSTPEYSDTCENNETTPLVSKQRLDQLKKRKAKLSADLNTLKEPQVNQYCKSDPDATLMHKPAHHLIAYNAQIAVDGKYKFIVATDISSKGVDHDQLYPMAIQAKEVTSNHQMKVAADAGYYSSKEIKKCSDEGIDVYVPEPDKQKKQKDKGKFSRDDFHYDETNDCYICPNDKVIKRRKTTMEQNGMKRFMLSGAGQNKSCRRECPDYAYL